VVDPQDDAKSLVRVEVIPKAMSGPTSVEGGDAAIDFHSTSLFVRMNGKPQARRHSTERPLHQRAAQLGVGGAAYFTHAVLEHDARLSHRLVVVTDGAEELLTGAP